MTKQKRFGELLIEGLQEAVAYERGELAARTRVVETSARGTCVDVPPVYDSNRIRAIRRLLAFSQRVFSEALNVSVQTVRGWEQGTRTPDGPTLRLLEIAEEHPEVIRAKVHRLSQVPR